MAQTAICYLGIGSNMGDRERSIAGAIERLSRLDGFTVTRVSGIIETEPVGCLGQAKFLNGVVEGETVLTPEALLASIHAIEEELGRVRTAKNGPRVIDIDILLYGDLVIDREDLIVPHPRMHERLFALVPLAEIAPDAVHPILKMKIRDLVQR